MDFAHLLRQRWDNRGLKTVKHKRPGNLLMAAPKIELDTTSPFGNRRPGIVARISWKIATASWLPGNLRKSVRKTYGYRAPGPFDIQVDGLNFRAYPAENYCDRVMFGRSALPEPAERALARDLVSTGMVFVDIGANVGTYSLDIARRAGPDATILAFEPHPRTFAKLSFNCAANSATGIRLFNKGIGPQEGKMELWSDGGGNIGHASLLPESAGKAVAKESVDIVVLAAVLATERINHIDLLKIDIEGFEDQALLPMFERAPKRLWPAAILLETVHRHLWKTDCLERLAELGYRVADETVENVLLKKAAT